MRRAALAAPLPRRRRTRDQPAPLARTYPYRPLQVEVHPYHRNDALLAFCAQHSIHVTAYAPLGSPDSASIFPRKKPLVLMEDPTVKVSRLAETDKLPGRWQGHRWRVD